MIRARMDSRRQTSRALAIIVAIVLLVGAFACENISGNADTVLSIQFDSLPAPAVVIGDTLRDTTGAVRTPSVHAFNDKGAEIPTAPCGFCRQTRASPSTAPRESSWATA